MELRTIENKVTNTIIIEKSKFITLLIPIEDEKQAKQILQEVRDEHPKAVHNCYAYVLKQEYQNIENQSDDGEPSKTAGMPMLEILRHEKLINVLAIVTRYFGGTLLGTGGLIRAYSSSVKKAVDLAQIKTAYLQQGYEIRVSYSLHNIIEYELKKYHAIIKSIKYEDQVVISFYTENNKLINVISEKVNKLIEIKKINSLYL